MEFDWYLVGNKTEFEATGLVSQEKEMILEGVGLKTILFTKGNLVSITYEGVMLSLGLTEDLPFIFDGHAVDYDEATGDIYLGIAVDED